jgi:ATP-binding cassette, subfamily B, bacterial
MKKAFLFLWASIKEYKGYYLFMLLAPIVGALYKPVIYYTIKMMVDIITNVNGFTYIQILTPFLIYVCADIFMSSMWRASEVAEWKSQPYVQRGILLNALKTILSFRYTFFQNVAGGSITSKIKGLLDGYTEMWTQIYFGLFFWILASITTGFSICLISYKLGILIFGWSLVYVWINYFFAKHINLLSQKQNEAKHDVIGEIADTVANIQSIKLFATRESEEQRLKDKITDSFIPKEIALLKYHFKINVFNDSMSIAIIAILILVMVNLRQNGDVSVGDFVFVFGMAFQFQDNLWRLMQELHRFSNHMGDLTSSLGIYEADKSEYRGAKFDNKQVDYKILYAYNPDPKQITLSNINHNTYEHNIIPNEHNINTIEPTVITSSSAAISNKESKTKNIPSIEFKNISFNYEGHDKLIFKDLNLTIHAGEKVGIVGFTGAGKSTLINLLLKIFKPQQGYVLLDGQDIATIDSDDLRRQIAVIPQDISLFHRDLLANIRYGNDVEASEVIAASSKAHADEFIKALPEGYNTHVGERGVKLSGGQRQRIAISRAILKNAPILILDEATSSLDSVTESYIQESIRELIKGKTVLAIAHRLSTLKDMDRLIVIENGQIVETGTHDQLLATPSLYAKIWHTQYSV